MTTTTPATATNAATTNRPRSVTDLCSVVVFHAGFRAPNSCWSWAKLAVACTVFPPPCRVIATSSKRTRTSSQTIRATWRTSTAVGGAPSDARTATEPSVLDPGPVVGVTWTEVYPALTNASSARINDPMAPPHPANTTAPTKATTTTANRRRIRRLTTTRRPADSTRLVDAT